jgi:hypothetical protein
MAVLTVASRANGALILPAMLAAAHVTQSNPHDGIVIDCKDVESLGKGNEKVMLTTNDGDVIVDGSVIPYLLDQSVLPRGAKKSGSVGDSFSAVFKHFSSFIRSMNGCIVLRILRFLILNHWTGP